MLKVIEVIKKGCFDKGAPNARVHAQADSYRTLHLCSILGRIGRALRASFPQHADAGRVALVHHLLVLRPCYLSATPHPLVLLHLQ